MPSPDRVAEEGDFDAAKRNSSKLVPSGQFGRMHGRRGIDSRKNGVAARRFVRLSADAFRFSVHRMQDVAGKHHAPRPFARNPKRRTELLRTSLDGSQVGICRIKEIRTDGFQAFFGNQVNIGLPVALDHQADTTESQPQDSAVLGCPRLDVRMHHVLLMGTGPLLGRSVLQLDLVQVQLDLVCFVNGQRRTSDGMDLHRARILQRRSHVSCRQLIPRTKPLMLLDCHSDMAHEIRKRRGILSENVELCYGNGFVRQTLGRHERSKVFLSQFGQIRSAAVRRIVVGSCPVVDSPSLAAHSLSNLQSRR
jgi:hypothetical protein